MSRPSLLGPAQAALILLGPTRATAEVRVRSIKPARYTDVGQYGAGSRDATLAALRGYLVSGGRPFLAPGQTLSVDVLDIDLAGAVEPWRDSFSDVRIMRGVTPPRINFAGC